MTELKSESGLETPLGNAEGRLMAAVARGDVGAFEGLYDRHAANVFGLAMHFLRDSRDAEEVTGDVFLAAWRNAARFDPEKGSVRTWLLTITRRRVIDRIRLRARARDTENAANHAAGLVERSDLVADEVQLRARSRDVATVLASLPESQRKALSLVILDGYTQAEISLVTGVPLGTVKSRIRLGLDRLRDTLARGGAPSALLDEVLAAA